MGTSVGTGMGRTPPPSVHSTTSKWVNASKTTFREACMFIWADSHKGPEAFVDKKENFGYRTEFIT